jgi:hypothetical protein
MPGWITVGVPYVSTVSILVVVVMLLSSILWLVFSRDKSGLELNLSEIAQFNLEEH